MKIDEIIALVKKELNNEGLKNTTLYIFKYLLQPNQPLVINRQEILIEEPAYLVFADLQPGANWAHACCYIIIYQNSGCVKTISNYFPPVMDSYRLLKKGENVETWTLMTEETINDDFFM